MAEERLVYFSKVSLDSREVYDLVDDRRRKSIIVSDVLAMLNNEISWEKVATYFNDGIEKEEKSTYTIEIINKDDQIIEGTIYRSFMIYTKKRGDKAGDMIKVPHDNTEDICFYYDVLHEYVAYIARRRFSVGMFNEAFAMILNTASEMKGHEYSFYVETFNEGLTIEEIQEQIRNDKEIRELTITYRPANPDDKIIDKVRQASDREKIRESNATERSVIYKAKGNAMINGGADVIQDDIRQLIDMNRGISIKEMTQRGYVIVTSRNQKGDVKTTTDSKQFSKVMKGFEEFKEVAKNGILEILGKA